MASVAPESSSFGLRPRFRPRMRSLLLTHASPDPVSPARSRIRIARLGLRACFFSILPALAAAMFYNELNQIEYQHLRGPVRIAKTAPGISLALNLSCPVVVCWQLSLFVQATYRGRSIRSFQLLDLVELLLNMGLMLTMLWIFGLDIEWCIVSALTLPIAFTYYMKRLVYNIYIYQGEGDRYYTWLIARIPSAATLVVSQFVWSMLIFTVTVFAQTPPERGSVFDPPICPGSVSCKPNELSSRKIYGLVQDSAISCGSEESWREVLAFLNCPLNRTDLCLFSSWQAACRYSYISPLVYNIGYTSWIVNTHMTVTYLFVFFPLFHAGRISYTRGATGEDEGQYDLSVFARSPHLVLALILLVAATALALLMAIWILFAFPFISQVHLSHPPISANRDTGYGYLHVAPPMCVLPRAWCARQINEQEIFWYLWGGAFFILNVDVLARVRGRAGAKQILTRDEKAAIEQALDQSKQTRRSVRTKNQSKHDCNVRTLFTGDNDIAAMGLDAYLFRGVDEAGLRKARRARDEDPVERIREEFEQHGTEDDRHWLNYVLREKAEPEILLLERNNMFGYSCNGGERDAGRGGETLDDFCEKPAAKRAQLKKEHVLALRLYTTPAFRSLNNPLRNFKRHENGDLVDPLTMATEHKFPTTIFYITDAIKKLRALESNEKNAVTLWRGMGGVSLPEAFCKHGGTEMAPMSTTRDVRVAIRYAQQEGSSVLFKLVAKSFMQFGAQLTWISVFPREEEILYPPLTHLKVIAGPEPIAGTPFTVIMVEPHLA